VPIDATAQTDLAHLLNQTITSGDASGLEQYLCDNSNLPGPRANLNLIIAFAKHIADLVRNSDAQGDALAAILDRWAALDLNAAPVNHPPEMLPACAAASYGFVAAARPDWRAHEIGKLRRAASDPRWRTREMVAFGLQQVLMVDWDSTVTELRRWLADPDPLVIRAAVTGMADPVVLTDEARAADGLEMSEQALDWLSALPADRRRDEDVKVLRKALGYTLSVAVAALPTPGFEAMRHYAPSTDPDVQRVIRENLKKNRLRKWPTEVASVSALLSQN